MSNVFEQNEPPISREEALSLGDRLYVLLPPLREGFEYRITTLEAGRSAVTIEKVS